MIAIDIGNSTITCARFSGGSLTLRMDLCTRDADPASIRTVITRLGALRTDEPVAVASVVPAACDRVLRVLADLGLAHPLVLDAGKHRILDHDLETPATTGVQRLLAARAAWELRGAADGRAGLVVIQAGSAVTVDAVDGCGVFRGGVILPGPRMWLDALSTAALIPRLDTDEIPWTGNPAQPGRSTRDSLLQGLALGLGGAIERTALAMTESVSASIRVLTGGWAEVLRPALRFDAVVVPDLVLHGIRLAAEATGHR